MGPLRLVVAAAALAVAAPAAASPVDRWRPLIVEASLRFGIPEEWILRVMRAESAGLTMLSGRPITSRAGAMGLMQVMPGTYAEMARLHGLGPDPHQPRDNILAGTAYLRAMYDRYGYPGLFAAYNTGPGRYEQHLRTGNPLPGETRAYVRSLAAEAASGAAAVSFARAEEPRSSVRARPRSGLFFDLTSAASAPPAALVEQRGASAPSGIFVRLSVAGSSPR